MNTVYGHLCLAFLHPGMSTDAILQHVQFPAQALSPEN